MILVTGEIKCSVDSANEIIGWISVHGVGTNSMGVFTTNDNKKTK
jgi:hypothetical protein